MLVIDISTQTLQNNSYFPSDFKFLTLTVDTIVHVNVHVVD